MRRSEVRPFFILFVLFILAACASPQASVAPADSPTAPLLTKTVPPTHTPEEPEPAQALPSETRLPTEPLETLATASPTLADEQGYANVVAVQAGGESGAYQFSVSVSSPDTGCDQFADWWEVLSEDGELLYRRILLHSHVGEQPFTRSGGPVEISPGDTVIVRAHMNTIGYGGAAMQGSPQDGFAAVELPTGFGGDLDSVEPLPQECAF